jgi:hypothetical protein
MLVQCLQALVELLSYAIVSAVVSVTSSTFKAAGGGLLLPQIRHGQRCNKLHLSIRSSSGRSHGGHVYHGSYPLIIIIMARCSHAFHLVSAFWHIACHSTGAQARGL